MPGVVKRRQTPLSPSEFFQPRADLSRSRKLRLAIHNWLNGLPIDPPEDVLTGIESDVQLSGPGGAAEAAGGRAARRRKRDLFKLRRWRRVPGPPAETSSADALVPDPLDDDSVLKKEKPAEGRPPIRVVQVPPPHLHAELHFPWHHQEGVDQQPNKKDDLNPYSVTNHIKTAKYSLLTFLPKNLFEQFRRAANCYFLFIVVLQAIPVISNYNVGLAALPLIIIVGITAAKDAFEDYKRYTQDKVVNFSLARTLRRTDLAPQAATKAHWLRRVLGRLRLLDEPTLGPVAADRLDWEQKFWKDVRVGDLVYLTNNQMMPADILILSTSEPDSACYVETKNLDGETNLKVKRGPQETAWIQSVDDAAEFRGHFEVELPSSNLYSFFGRLVLPAESECLAEMQRDLAEAPQADPLEAAAEAGERARQKAAEAAKKLELSDAGSAEFVDVRPTTLVPISTAHLLLRGCVLRNTSHVIGVVIYTGPHTKLILNSGGTPSKRSRIERQMNPQVCAAPPATDRCG